MDKWPKLNLPSAIEFGRRLFLCTTLYSNLMQASDFGGTFDQVFLSIFYIIFTEDASLQIYLFYLFIYIINMFYKDCQIVQID